MVCELVCWQCSLRNRLVHHWVCSADVRCWDHSWWRWWLWWLTSIFPPIAPCSTRPQKDQILPIWSDLSISDYHDLHRDIFLLVTQPMWIRICLVRGIKIPLENSLWRWREWRWLWWWWRLWWYSWLWWFSWKYQASRQTEPATKVGPTGRAPLVHPKLKTNNFSQNTYTLHKNLGSTPPPCWSKRPFSGL